VIHFLERLVDTAARELDIDPAELRRRNQIPSDAFPYETAVGSVYDSGDYERNLDLALDTVGYDDLRERQAALREEGRYLGIGIAYFVENSGSGPGMGETSRVRVFDNGSATAWLGTHDHGQGHWTTFSQLLADELELDYEAIEINEGDTDDLPQGTGTFGSRSAALGGSAMQQAAEAVKERAREVAAAALEVAPADLEFDEGAFQVTGAPSRSIHLREIAATLEDRGEALEATEYYDPPNYGYSFGAHVAAVDAVQEEGSADACRCVLEVRKRTCRNL
jgi:carbon-monoxide dehydrogenase large subunit